jgi:hypothetical protein
MENGRPTVTRLKRAASLPRPSGRVDGWRQDLEYVLAQMEDYDRSFSRSARAAFRRAIIELERDASHESDAEILVGLSRAVALADNAHTRLRMDPTRQGAFTTEFPIRMWSFADGTYVIRAVPGYERALRCRVVAIGGHPIGEALAEAAKLFGGNDSWANYLGPLYLTSPDILAGLGLIPSSSQASFTFEDAERNQFTLSIRSQAVNRKAMAHESWQELSPAVPTGRPAWKTALAAGSNELPLYLRHPEKAYWYEFQPQSGLLYFQFNRSGDDDTGPSFQQFGDSLLAFARSHAVRDVVIDLRLNAGGNLDVAKSFMKNLGQEAEINRRDHLFVITSKCTFSAGLYHAAQLKQFTDAIFVGEPVGDRLDFWAEGGEIELPNSRASIRYSNGFHRYSGKDYPANQPYYEELNVPALVPDIPVPTRFTDYLSLRDPALEAIQARLRQ